MKQDCIPVVKPTIEEIQEQFIAWPNNRRCREPVPDALWELAVSLIEDYSIGQICKVLGLNHRQLKRKVQAHSGNGYQEEGRSCHFVELEVSKPVSDAPEFDMVSKPEFDMVSKPAFDTENVMEMEDQTRSHYRNGREDSYHFS